MSGSRSKEFPSLEVKVKNSHQWNWKKRFPIGGSKSKEFPSVEVEEKISLQRSRRKSTVYDF
jgi:hypothetical protein